MLSSTKLAISLHLCKRAEAHIQKGTSAKIKNWDTIKGIPSSLLANKDEVDIDNPNPMNISKDIYSYNKQLISGTGNGPAIS